MIEYVLHKDSGEIVLSGVAEAEDAISALASASGYSYAFGLGSNLTHYVKDGSLVAYSEVEIERLNSGRREWHVWSIQEKDWIDVRPADMKVSHRSSEVRAALDAVDSAAGSARMRYITSVPGQAETYSKKEQQARAWIASGFEGEAPSFIAAEAAALDVRPEVLAAEVVAVANLWENDKGPAIEAARRKWKVLISGAGNDADLNAMVASARAELDAL